MTETTETLLARDQRVYSSLKATTGEYLRHASRKSGRTPLSLVAEYLKLRRGPGKMTLPEYVQYGIYDPALSNEERLRFITNTIHWPITHQCCDMTWQATTEDSWLCARVLEGSGIPMPQTLAVIDRTDRTYPGTRTVHTPSEFRDVARAHVRDGASVFGKENRGVSGFGTFLIQEAERDRLHIEGEGWFSYEQCLDNLIGDTAYILQPFEHNHAFINRYTNHLATVRICLLLTREGPKIPFAVLKLPSEGRNSDHYLAKRKSGLRPRSADRGRPTSANQGTARHHRLHRPSGDGHAARRRDTAPLGRRPRPRARLLADLHSRPLPVDGCGDYARRTDVD